MLPGIGTRTGNRKNVSGTGALYWADIAIGEEIVSASTAIAERDIKEFAIEFDPQPYHLDSEAGDNSIFGGLCASGWHVTAVMMRLLTDSFAARQIELLGSSSVSRVSWRKPVFANDCLKSTLVVAKKSASDDARYGYIECDVDVTNQHGQSVIILNTTLMVATGPEEN